MTLNTNTCIHNLRATDHDLYIMMLIYTITMCISILISYLKSDLKKKNIFALVIS